MNTVIICISILTLFIEVIVADFRIDGCYYVNNHTETITLTCNTFKKPVSKPNCTVEFDRCQVKSVKYECERKLGFLSLDPNLLKTLPNACAVDFSGLGISNFDVLYHKNVISGKVDTPTLSITSLNASHNQLSQIPNASLAKMPNITEIDFSFNKFTSLHCIDFDGAFQLTSIDFSNNNISILEIDVLSKQQNLEILNLNDNAITRLNRSHFMNNTKLKWLNLQNNPLIHFNFNIFSPNVKSITVHLPSRSIHTLDVSCRRKNCLFKRFNDADYFENVRLFNASGNQFRNISELLEKLGSTLRTLDLSRNFVNELNISVLAEFPNLEQIKMSHANLSRTGFETFAYQSKLKLLDLSYNRLSDLSPKFACPRFVNLESLNLEGNQLTAIDSVVPALFPNLSTLSISRNRFNCLYLKSYLEQWENAENFRFVGNAESFEINIKGVDCYLEPTNDIQKPQNSDYFSLATLYLVVIVIFIAVLLSVLAALTIFQAFRSLDRPKVEEVHVQTVEIPESIEDQIQDMRLVRSELAGDSEPDYDEIDTQSIVFEQRQPETPMFGNRSLPMPPHFDQHQYGRIRNCPMAATSTITPYAYARVFKRDFT